MNQDIEEITLYFSEGKDLSGYDFQISDWFNIWSALEGFPIASSFDNSSLYSIYDAVNSGFQSFEGENLDLFYIYEKAKGNEVSNPEFENESLKRLFNAWINGPQNVVLPEITGTPHEGLTLTCSTGTWSGEGTITYAFQWKRNGVDILGERNATYVLVEADSNQQISCEVSATDDQGTTRRSSNSVLALGAPFNLVAPVITGVQQVGEELEATIGTWQGVEPITFDYGWKRNDITIPGATSTNYTLTADDYGAVIKFLVVATNVYDSVDQESNPTGAIAGIAPSISDVPTFSGTENVGEDLTAVFASSSGVPTPTNSIQWQRSSDGVSGWVDIAGATSLVYTLVLADEGNYVRCVQTATNVEGIATANSVASGEIQPESSAIYGLQFDGINDNATLDFSSESSNIFEIEFYNIDNTTTRVANAQINGNSDGICIGIDEFSNLCMTQPNSAVGGAAIPYVSGQVIFSGDVSDTITTGLINGLNNTTPGRIRGTSSLADNSIYVGARADGNFPNGGVLFSAKMGNLTLNDSNNWGGATINGATRVQSTDGGLTWTPAP